MYFDLLTQDALAANQKAKPASKPSKPEQSPSPSPQASKPQPPATTSATTSPSDKASGDATPVEGGTATAALVETGGTGERRVYEEDKLAGYLWSMR